MKKRTAEFQYQARMELGKASIVVWGYDKSGTSSAALRSTVLDSRSTPAQKAARN